MSKRCYLDKFARFLPEDISPNLTADQIKALAALDSKDAAKLLGRMSEIPDKRVADLMSKMLSPEQVGKVSRIGQPITENEKAAQAEAMRDPINALHSARVRETVAALSVASDCDSPAFAAELDSTRGQASGQVRQAFAQVTC